MHIAPAAVQVPRMQQPPPLHAFAAQQIWLAAPHAMATPPGPIFVVAPPPHVASPRKMAALRIERRRDADAGLKVSLMGKSPSLSDREADHGSLAARSWPVCEGGEGPSSFFSSSAHVPGAQIVSYGDRGVAEALPLSLRDDNWNSCAIMGSRMSRAKSGSVTAARRRDTSQARLETRQDFSSRPHATQAVGDCEA